MRPVSARFLDALTGSHRMVARVRACYPLQTGTNPSSTELPVLSGQVRLSARADVKGTLEVTTRAGWAADAVAPYGVELYVERGIDFGDGTREWVGLGYYRIETAEQDDAPYGPIRLTASDRCAQIIQNRRLFPRQVGSITHRQAFERFINAATVPEEGDGTGIWHYAAWENTTPLPILFPAYDPDLAMTEPTVVEDSVFDYLSGLAERRGCTLLPDAAGRLVVKPTSAGGPAVWKVTAGAGGSLVKASRTLTRKGVYNIVSARGSDVAFETGYRIAYRRGAPTGWTGTRFGAAPRYFSSPLLKDANAAQTAAETLVQKYTGAPYTLELTSVPNPALELFDVIEVRLGTGTSTERHVVDELTIPLTADRGCTIRTRTLNAVEDDS